MNETEKFILGESLSKSSKNENMSLNLNLSGNKRILPDASIDAMIDAYEVYLNERKNSNKFRITVNINPYCSNVLFNPFTEIVMHNNNGSIEALNFYYNPNTDSGVTTQKLIDDGFLSEGDVIGKCNEDGEEDFVWNSYKSIRDTQFSNKKCDFEYYCGADIFNNHVLRNTSFKTVTYTNSSSFPISNYSDIYGSSYNKMVNGRVLEKYNYVIPEFFNTIDDYMRDRNGIIVSNYTPVVIYNSSDSNNECKEFIGAGTICRTDRRNCEVKEISCPLHLYQNYDVYTFKESVEKNLFENNGWFGFRNKSIVNTISFVNNNEFIYDINKVINNKGCNDFIDMYPTRSHFSFSPYYNESKERLEKNWDYCLTYPSKSVTKMLNGNSFPFFEYLKNEKLNNETVALSVLMIDEYTVTDDGRPVVTVYSICQHGLITGDKINVYVNGEIFYESIEVVNIVDKYIFQFYKQSANISNQWVDLNDTKIIENEDGHNVVKVKYFENGEEIERTLVDNGAFLYEDGVRYYIAASNRCNIDNHVKTVSFKRVVENVECKYYVRIFSRLPNFKFKDSEINDETLYGDSSDELDLINRYSDPSVKTNDFENHISKLSFSETAYGDDNTEIVYTDDIDISYLRDNLGRPVNEIFFTIVKNNKGYEKWYGVEGNIIDANDDSIEKSHCFGRNNSSFILSDYYLNSISNSFYDVRNISLTHFGLMYEDNTDKIVFNKTNKFYGDLCCYSPIDCDEQIIQTVHNRFNTVQRELSEYTDGSSTNRYFYDGNLYYDEIIDDESVGFDLSGGKTITENDIDFYKQFNSKVGILRHSTYSKYILDDYRNESFSGMTKQTEGYYYKSHYKIRLKTISKSITYDEPYKYDLYEIKNFENLLEIKTLEKNPFEIHDKLILYLKNKNIYYYLTVKEIFTEKHFSCYVNDEEYNPAIIDYVDLDIDNISLVKKSDYVPYYARLIKDGSCRFYWREIISNGIEEGDSKVYPFTNGAFYINKNINFYLKRQDPTKEKMYSSVELGYVPSGQILNLQSTYENDYYEADEIETC